VLVIAAWLALLAVAFRTSFVLFVVVFIAWMTFLAYFFARIMPKYRAGIRK
jgi:hypothetical protein